MTYRIYLGRFFLHPMKGGHWRKSTNDSVRKPDRNSDAASGTNFRIGVFIKASTILIFDFLFNKAD
jgi:hypothetical protein